MRAIHHHVSHLEAVDTFGHYPLHLPYANDRIAYFYGLSNNSRNQHICIKVRTSIFYQATSSTQKSTVTALDSKDDLIYTVCPVGKFGSFGDLVK